MDRECTVIAHRFGLQLGRPGDGNGPATQPGHTPTRAVFWDAARVTDLVKEGGSLASIRSVLWVLKSTNLKIVTRGNSGTSGMMRASLKTATTLQLMG